LLSNRYSSKGTIPTEKGITITILGAISQVGIIDVSLKKAQAVFVTKKRKVYDTTATVINGRVGTRTENFLACIYRTGWMYSIDMA
jgi:hypothetical protein